MKRSSEAKVRSAANRASARAATGSARAAARVLLAAALLLPGVARLLVVPSCAGAQTVAKAIQGTVLDADKKPLPGSIVYLQDQKTYIVKTFIATGDGGYRFGQLPTDTDYKVWAEYKGKQSKSKLINSFDTKLKVTLNFYIGK